MASSGRGPADTIGSSIAARMLMMPMTTSDVAGMLSDVLAKSIAVEVMVVKPMGNKSSISQ